MASTAWHSAALPIEEASTPPSSWYTTPEVLEREVAQVFTQHWVCVGHLGGLESPGSFQSGTYLDMPWVVTRADDGQLRAFHNVCQHHAAAVATGSGCAQVLRCSYHGWEYGLNGRLRKAPGADGIRSFHADQIALQPIGVAMLGHLCFLHFGSERGSLQDQLGDDQLQDMAAAGIMDAGLRHVATRNYSLKCNWKVFADNYLDGGYHVPVAHPDLAAALDLTTYSSKIYRTSSVQSCRAKGTPEARLGDREAAYAFLYPNLMVNRYGPWMDTNIVTPTGPESCIVRFDWWLEEHLCHDSALTEQSLADSEQVQQEDIALCEAVQRGLRSPAYDSGRYAPQFEEPMFHFHKLLHADLNR
ncbi:g1882 [Coccomyxa viridis]|uniref:Choline monooxygenase, chloroplastic n=1 Tax=Coccomyxa viridis TaxID=1274662 RepID=A0ABP1FJ12_9CHLO